MMRTSEPDLMDTQIQTLSQRDLAVADRLL